MCGWHMYLALISGLVALSAGLKTPVGAACVAAAAASLFLITSTVRLYPPALVLAADLLVLGAGVFALLASRRADTRNIALLMAGGGVLPVLAFFWQP
jgi:hypothetical protein